MFGNMGLIHFPRFPKKQNDEDSAKWRSPRRPEGYTWHPRALGTESGVSTPGATRSLAQVPVICTTLGQVTYPARMELHPESQDPAGFVWGLGFGLFVSPFPSSAPPRSTGVLESPVRSHILGSVPPPPGGEEQTRGGAVWEGPTVARTRDTHAHAYRGQVGHERSKPTTLLAQTLCKHVGCLNS